jgi:hypothetical protein
MPMHTHRVSFRSSHVLVGVSTGLMLLAGGCQSPPPGSTGGRLDPAGTTRAEANDPQVLPSALFEFSDRVSEQLATDLRGIPELQGQKVTVVFGDIMNKTGIVPSSDFEAFRTRIRGRLMQSGVVRQDVRFVEMRQRVDNLIQRETGKAGREQASRDGRYLERKELDPSSTYFLNGEMYRVDRGGERVNLYLLNYTLTKMDDGAIVWQNTPYEIKQRAGY